MKKVSKVISALLAICFVFSLISGSVLTSYAHTIVDKNNPKVLFSDDFTGALNSDWKKEYQNYTYNGVTAASISNGALNFNNNGFFYSYANAAAYNWSDYSVESDINVTPWAGNATNHGMAGRVNSDGTGYRFFYSGIENDFILMYSTKDGIYGHRWWMSGGASLVRVENSFLSNADPNNMGVHKFKMEFAGSVIKCYVDNTLVLSYTETDALRNTKGTIGLYVFNHTHSGWFDNVKVTEDNLVAHIDDLSDVFSGSLNTKWTKDYQNYSYNGGTDAAINDGKLSFQNNGFFYSYHDTAAYDWNDYTVEADINVTPWGGNGSNHGIAGRVNNQGTGYRFFYSALQNDFVLMYSSADGYYGHEWGYIRGGTSLSRVDNTIISNADQNNLGVHQFKMEFTGDTIKCYVDNKLITTYKETDATRNAKGTIGLYIYNHTHNGWFDNIKVFHNPKLNIELAFADNKINLTATEAISDYTYQIWSEETTDEGTNWKLVKSFGGFSNISGTSATDSWIPEGLGDNYKVFIRVKDGNGNLIQTLNKQFSKKQIGIFKVDSLAVDGLISSAVTTKNAGSTVVFQASAQKAIGNDTNIVYDFYLNNQLKRSSSENTYSWAIPSDLVPGMNNVKLVAYQQGAPNNADTIEAKLLVVNPSASVPLLPNGGFEAPTTVALGSSYNFAMNATGGTSQRYSFSIGEPMRGASYKVGSSNYNFNFAYPGVYQVFGSVKELDTNSISDGAYKYIRVTRPNAKVLNRNAVVILNASNNSGVFSAMKGTQIKVTAENDNNLLYSFWRLDSRGYRLVQGWSNTNELVWTPAQAGNYSIQIRVKDALFAGIDEASYEDAQTYSFSIGGADQLLSNVAITAPDSAIQRTAVNLSAAVTATIQENVMYRFEVIDFDMGTQTIQPYSMDNTATFIPRKAGTYTIRVLAKDAGNFGYFDVIGTKVITVTDH